ncbi:MAG: glycosyltransferase family 39 protein, partial [Anaerolineae bacterium]|nr:glycosyltransferase family 39 protein [Anaerolineae bacterium]
LIALLILLLAAALRFYNLGAQSFWNDEGNSYVQATRSFAAIAANAARDIHPPGYYWLLAIWRVLVGESEFALRALSAFASVISVALAYVVGQRLSGDLAARTAALLTAINTFSLYYAQETRMYALLALWGAAGFWALIRFGERPTWRRALVLGMINAAGLWTQYAYPFLMLAQGVIAILWLLGTNRSRTEVKGLRTETTSGQSDREVRDTSTQLSSDSSVLSPQSLSLRPQSSVLSPLLRYIAANLLTIALYAPWLPTAIQQITTWPNTGDQTPILEALGISLRWLTFGLTAGDLPLAIPLILVLFGLTVRRRESIWRLALPAAWALIPLAIFLLSGLYRPDNVKVIIASQIGLALMIGRGVQVLWALDVPRRRLVTRIAAGAALIWIVGTGINVLPPLYSDPAYQRPDYRGITRLISEQARAGDAIILDAPNQAEVFNYYWTRQTSSLESIPVHPLPPGLGGDDAETRAAVEAVLAEAERVYVVFWGETERDPQRVVETTLDANAFELGDTWYGDVRLARYVTAAPLPIARESGAQFGDQITLERYALNAETFQRGDALQIQFTWQTAAPLTTRYKVFVQILDQTGVLVAQRDSEPGGGLAITSTWTPDQPVTDNHALLIDLPPGAYTLIAGLYSTEPPYARLSVGAGDYLTLTTITVE